MLIFFFNVTYLKFSPAIKQPGPASVLFNSFLPPVVVHAPPPRGATWSSPKRWQLRAFTTSPHPQIPAHGLGAPRRSLGLFGFLAQVAQNFWLIRVLNKGNLQN